MKRMAVLVAGLAAAAGVPESGSAQATGGSQADRARAVQGSGPWLATRGFDPAPYRKPGLPVSVTTRYPVRGEAGAWIPVQLTITGDFIWGELEFGSSTGLQLSETSHRVRCDGLCGAADGERGLVHGLRVRSETEGRHYLDVILRIGGQLRAQSIAVQVGDTAAVAGRTNVKASGKTVPQRVETLPDGTRMRLMDGAETVDGVAVLRAPGEVE